jgi:predicted GNAT superfamily acetyltransferase
MGRDVKSHKMFAVTPALLALNNAHATELSWVEPARFQALIRQAYFAARLGEADGFMLAFDHRAEHDSPNYRWFRARYPRFVYVDRVVVDPAMRGRGFARSLYAAVMERARADGHTLIACEVNLDPPNPASDAFHGALGFTEAGRAGVGSKIVRYLTRAL